MGVLNVQRCKIINSENNLTIFIDTIYKCAPISNYGNFILNLQGVNNSFL